MVLIVQVKLPVKALRLSTESFGHRRGFVRAAISRAAQRFCFCPVCPASAAWHGAQRIDGIAFSDPGRIKECAHRAAIPICGEVLRNLLLDDLPSLALHCLAAGILSRFRLLVCLLASGPCIVCPVGLIRW